MNTGTPSLQTPEDLFALVSTMPEQDKFLFLGIMSRMKKGRITVSQALEEVKMLLFKNGIFHDGNQEDSK